MSPTRIGHASRRPAAALAVFAIAIGAAAVAPGAASSAPALPAGCEQLAGDAGVRCVYTEGSHTLALPAGIRTVEATAIGAAGGNIVDDRHPHLGGRGAQVTANLNLPSSARTLHVIVGSPGHDTSGWNNQIPGQGGSNGGGDGGRSNTFDANPAGAGGGGASDIRTTAGDLSSRLFVAAGGGGATPSRCGDGGDAGAPGSANEPDLTPSAGQPGTPTTGGAGGANDPDHSEPGWDGSPGRLGHGGAGATAYAGGAGGGGGLYGGGGGSVQCAGGGGSSLVPTSGVLDLAERGTAPRITITYRTRTPQSCTSSLCFGS
nr:glycine-rich protein [Gordonia soli]